MHKNIKQENNSFAQKKQHHRHQKKIKKQKYDTSSQSSEKRSRSKRKHKKDKQHNKDYNKISQTQNKQQIFENKQHQQICQNDKLQQSIKKEFPCFQPSGILLQYYNSREGVSLKFFEPPQGRNPTQNWRIYVFKGEQVLKPIMLQKSAYLIGKDERVADILCQNPSISRQHAVIQFRLVQKNFRLETQNGFEIKETIQPYIMDLESTNGTFLNEQKIQSGRYYQLLHKDLLKFGFSQRQYVIVKWEEQNQQNQDNQQ